MTADLSTAAGSLVAHTTATGPTPGAGDAAGSLVAADAPSLVQSIDWLAIAPPTLTALAALIVLVADLFLPVHRKRLLGYGALTALAAALALLIPLRAGDRATFCVTTGAQACSYTADHFTLVIQALVLGGAFLTVLLSLDDTRKLPAGSTGSCSWPPPPGPPCCRPPATSPRSSSPSKSPRCPRSPSSASCAATGAPPRPR